VIIDAIWTVLTTPITLLLGALGSLPAPPSISPISFVEGSGHSVFNTVLSGLRWANWYVPVDDAVAIGGTILVVVVGIMPAYKIISWVLAKTHVTGAE
jgi:hypothetical protein